MEITQQVRDYAANQGAEVPAAIESGMADKASEFRKAGEIYLRRE
jgi:phosphomethylpyrimidine synthase